MMKQIHLKLLVCLLLAISAAAQYNNNPIQWGSNVQGQPYSNNWPGAAANWPSASANWLGASANWPGASANWPGASANWPYGRYGQPANVLQYGVDYGQFNSGSQMVQPTYNQQTRVETNGADSAGAAEEIDSLISVPAPNRGGKDNSCYSIMDPLYPLFSLHCSALPQTTFSLPNFFGHTTKQETNELFTLFRPLLNSGCFRQMPKFLCPLFFPSCSKERILPCAKFCRDIQSRCRDSYISTIDCDLLPEKSEFCPRIAETSRSTNDTQDRYRSASENEKIPQPFVSIDYSDNSSAQSSVIQSSSTNNAAQKHVNSDASYGGMSSSASSDFSATNIKPTPVPKIISTVSELSNLNQDGTYNQQWTIGGLSSSGNNNNYVAGSFGSNIIASADSSPAGKIGNSAVESSEAKTIEFAGTSSYGNNNNAAGISSSFGSNSNAAGVSSLPGNVVGISSSFGSNNNAAGTSSYGNNNNVAGVLSSSGNVAGVSSSSGNVAGISSSFGSNNNAAGVSSSSGRIKNTAGILSSFGSNSNAAGVAASSNINNSRNTGQISSSNSYVASGRFEQTGIPYGLQSTVEYLYYYPEKLDLSKCGPPQTKNPCTINGPQLYPIPGYPQCYIQCAFGLMFVKPCPGDLVWNALINVCDWSTVPDPVDDNNSDDLSNSNNNPKSPSYHSSRREKRSLNQLKKIPKENNPFPNFKRLNVPLGPPAPGYTPLPGFSGPIGIAGPYASPPAAPQSAPTMIYPFGPIQYPTLSHDMSRSIFSPPLQQTVPQQVLSPPLPPPMPPPIYTRLPPLNKPIVSPPVMPNYYSPYMWPSSPMNYPMVRSPVMPQPTFPQQIMYPSIYPPIWQPPQTPKLPPFIPPILPSLPIPLGGPLLPPLPMKIPATFIPGPPPIFSDSSFGPFDQPQVSSDGSSTGGQSVSAKGPEIIFSTSELMDRLHYNGNIGFPPLHGAPGGSSWATNLYGGFPGQFPPIGIYGKIKGSQSSKKQGSTNNNDDNDEDEDEKPNSSNEDEDEDEDEDKDEDDSNTSKASPNNKNDNSKSDNDSDEQDNSRKKRQVVSDDDENTLLSVENDGASPCIGKSINVNVRHPTDPTKYISCLNENKYEIMNCPTSFIYNADDDKCEKINIKSICEQEQPCMNNGECHSTSPTTFTCTCQGLWTGERCEIPVSSCASNPCGEGNQCHTLVTSDYKQDYICICDKQQSYGLTCTHNTVPNPCMGVFNNQERFYPFAFNSRAFLQCDGDLLHVRPCAPGLHWNQETKVCDRVESPSFIRPTSDYRYQDYYPRIPSNDLRYNTYQETPTTYPMFSPSSTIKGSRRLKHKQRLMSNNIHASPYDQDSTVADQQYAQSFNQLPPNSFVSSPPQRHLFRLFQSPSSYRR
ncbi:unnamed protein product [Rotaria socialis]|uniref:Uncharacterized protein n=1 Tax=Rotaria socialis TaxID=392032 RepID=A0A817PRB6_9BILA|nr:unnamed protein product [Rotaria socialis]CAF4138075.1 unnamed protein product [Rotaria socialis]